MEGRRVRTLGLQHGHPLKVYFAVVPVQEALGGPEHWRDDSELPGGEEAQAQ